MMAKTLNQLFTDQSDRLDAVVEEFTSRLDVMVEEARVAVLKALENRITTTDGVVTPAASNQRALNNIDTMFMKELEARGYDDLVSSFTGSFDGTFSYFSETMDFINANLVYPLPDIKFGSPELSEFKATKITSGTLLKDVMYKVSANAKRQALLAMGGMDHRALTEEISTQFGKAIGESTSLADTAISSFYRNITDTGFQKIEADLPGFKIRYTYDGPLDKLNRPFCLRVERLARTGKSWTREEINKMNNGQLPNVFVSGGGFRCRHQWMIALDDLRAQQVAKGAPGEPGKKPARTREGTARELAARRKVSDAQMASTESARPKLEALRAASKASLGHVRARREARG
jgi:hypothetical protein